MAIRFYDEAVCNKIQKWIKDPNLRIIKPNESSRLFQMRNDQEDDKPLTLPLISISRDPNVEISIPTKRCLSCEGLTLSGDKLTSIQLNAIPIQLNYQLDIYTRWVDEADEYVRNFIFNLSDFPKMKVRIPYNGAEIEHICYIRVLNTIADNSDIAEKAFPDQFSRWTIQFTIQDAYLFSLPIVNNAQIVGAKLHVYNGNSESSLEEVSEEEFDFDVKTK